MHSADDVLARGAPHTTLRRSVSAAHANTTRSSRFFAGVRIGEPTFFPLFFLSFFFLAAVFLANSLVHPTPLATTQSSWLARQPPPALHYRHGDICVGLQTSLLATASMLPLAPFLTVCLNVEAGRPRPLCHIAR